MNIFDGEFEAIYIKKDPTTGLKMAIAIHDRTLGRALGGVRFFNYGNEKEWLIDAIRLAHAMTYKNAIIYRLSRGQLSHGGGKAVIWGDPKKDKTPELLLAAADAINDLRGQYIGGEDMNMNTDDIEIMYERTTFVAGLQETHHRGDRKGSGDPSSVTALGVFEGIRACLEFIFGTYYLRPRKFAISGIGSVGMHILEYLVTRGAGEITASDIDDEKIMRAKLRYPKYRYPRIKFLEAKDADQIFDEKCDVFVPCAIGGIINDETISRLKCRIIAGAANNQLLEPRHGEELWGREAQILYAPDYVINAGGAINVASELDVGGYDHENARGTTRRIGPLLADIFHKARGKDTPPERIADQLAERTIENAGNNF